MNAHVQHKPRYRIQANDTSGATARILPPKPKPFNAFDAGKYGRRLRAVPTTSDAINRLIRTFGKTVLARSRYLCANNAYAANAKEAFVNALVGSGIKPSPLLNDELAELKKEVVKAWRDWTDECDADGLTDLYGLQVLAAGEMFEAGECFIRLRARRVEDGLLVPLQLQLIPAEMLDISFNFSAVNQNRIECGIEFDAIGRRVAYHFFTNHPNNDVFSRNPALPLRTRVPASEVLHLYKPMQAGQIRGVPHTISAITKCAIFDAYEDAELERKRTAALFSGFVTRPARDDASFPLENPTDPLASIPTQGNAFGLEPGVMVDLAEGEEVQFATPADVGATYEPFMYRQLLGISAGFGVPYMHMTGDQRQTSYGTQRAAELMFRRRIEAMQHQVMVFQFCRPVWSRWLLDAVLVQAVPLDIVSFNADPRLYTRVKWIPPKWDWIDPLKDRQAEKLAVDNGWKSRDDVIEAEGYDPEEVDARILASQERADELGINIEGPKQPTPPPQFDEDGNLIPPEELVPPEGEDDETEANEEDEQKPKPPVPRRKGKPSRPSAEAQSAAVGDAGATAGDGGGDGNGIVVNPPSVYLEVHNHPHPRGHRTKVLAHDSNGRILETETVPIGEDGQDG